MSNFALDASILSSVRPKIIKIQGVTRPNMHVNISMPVDVKGLNIHQGLDIPTSKALAQACANDKLHERQHK